MENISQKNRQSTPAGLQARQTASRLLGTVTDKKTSLDSLTDDEYGHPLFLALASRDRALVRAILGAALRHRGNIKAVLDCFLKRPLPERANALLHLLHVAAAQILYLDVPDRAAVHLAVTSARENPKLVRFSGLVNAVLRRLSNEVETIKDMQDPLANAPQWFRNMLIKAYGSEKTKAILTIQQYEPPLDITVKNNPQIWAKKLDGQVLPNGTVRLPRLSGPLTELPGFTEGGWWIQNVAASLPVRLMGDIRGKRVADLCSAPGGKTAQMVLSGAHVTAVDLSASRLKRLKHNMDRLDFRVEVHEGDFRKMEPDQLFDSVMLDTPCSSTGISRRHPDVLWTRDGNDICKLASLQITLLHHAIRLTRRGGMIIFSNCSLDPREGEELVNAFPSLGKDVVFVPVLPEEIPGFGHLITEKGFLRTTPDDLHNDNPRLSGMDGFFAARLKRL